MGTDRVIDILLSTGAILLALVFIHSIWSGKLFSAFVVFFIFSAVAIARRRRGTGHSPSPGASAPGYGDVAPRAIRFGEATFR